MDTPENTDPPNTKETDKTFCIKQRELFNQSEAGGRVVSHYFTWKGGYWDPVKLSPHLSSGCHRTKPDHDLPQDLHRR